MSWEIGYDDDWHRDIGYGVPSYCDHPGCAAEIDRGLSYVCGGEAYGGDTGCGLFFCPTHLAWTRKRLRNGNLYSAQHCLRCVSRKPPYTPKTDHPSWTLHKATDPSWADWRAEIAVKP